MGHRQGVATLRRFEEGISHKGTKPQRTAQQGNKSEGKRMGLKTKLGLSEETYAPAVAAMDPVA